MEKIARWWVEFLVQLEAGKRVVAILLIICFILGYALVGSIVKLDTEKADKFEIEKNHGLEIARLKDSTAVDKTRYMNYYNDKTENIYKEQLEKLNQVERNAKNVQEVNNKILKSK